LDFAGVTIPEVVQGRSMRLLAEQTPPDDWRESMFYSYHEDSWTRSLVPGFNPGQYGTPHRVTPHRGVRTDRHKLIEYYREGDYWELFDLQEDPNELKNIYKDPGSAFVVEDLRTQLRALQEQYGATDEVTSQPATG
jgi:arylsulfatase A-like enzyme